ncbi:MAG: HAD family hydrolase [Propionicimonas sp.]
MKLFVVRAGQVVGAPGLADEVRPESAQAVAALHRLGVRVAMITGDARPVADRGGSELGIDTVLAEVRPRRSAKVAELQAAANGSRWWGTASTTPCPVQADVGPAIGAGTDVAIASAGSSSPATTRARWCR